MIEDSGKKKWRGEISRSAKRLGPYNHRVLLKRKGGNWIIKKKVQKK